MARLQRTSSPLSASAFNYMFNNVDPATINLVADSYVKAYASATYGSTD